MNPIVAQPRVGSVFVFSKHHPPVWVVGKNRNFKDGCNTLGLVLTLMQPHFYVLLQFVREDGGTVGKQKPSRLRLRIQLRIVTGTGSRVGMSLKADNFCGRCRSRCPQLCIVYIYIYIWIIYTYMYIYIYISNYILSLVVVFGPFGHILCHVRVHILSFRG